MNFFYLDKTNQKHGPINALQLKEQALQGIIEPHTPMETDTGHQGIATKITDLFSETVQSESERSVSKQFCTNCGQPVCEYGDACKTCGMKVMGHQKFCYRRGVVLALAQIVCVRCGTRIAFKIR